MGGGLVGRQTPTSERSPAVENRTQPGMALQEARVKGTPRALKYGKPRRKRKRAAFDFWSSMSLLVDPFATPYTPNRSASERLHSALCRVGRLMKHAADEVATDPRQR
jgi:hypothetical protein